MNNVLKEYASNDIREATKNPKSINQTIYKHH